MKASPYQSCRPDPQRARLKGVQASMPKETEHVATSREHRTRQAGTTLYSACGRGSRHTCVRVHAKPVALVK